jgi:hypothetical protein
MVTQSGASNFSHSRLRTAELHVEIDLKLTMAALVEDFVHVQTATFDTSVRFGGCNTELVPGLDECPGKRAQRRLAVKTGATRLAHKAILWSRHWRRFTLHDSE